MNNAFFGNSFIEIRHIQYNTYVFEFVTKDKFSRLALLDQRVWFVKGIPSYNGMSNE